MKKISVTIPVYNEEENIPLAYEAINKQLMSLEGYDYEMVFADNGSQDKSREVLREIAKKDHHVKVIFNQTNFGVERSQTNLFKRATGDAIIAIPCDLQEPPELIPDFVKEWENGNDIVWGQKTSSRENPIKYLCRKIYYGIINSMADFRQFHQTTGFGLISREVRDIIIMQKEQDSDLSIRNIVGEYGFTVKLLPYEQQKRKFGKSSYNLYRYYSFALSSFCSTSIKPLRIMTAVGFLSALGCFVVAVVYLVYKLTHWYTFDAGMAPLVIGLFFCAAVQLLCMGIMGEYIAIILRRVTKKPNVIEKEALNFDEEVDK